MFPLIRLALQVVLKTNFLGNKDSCKKFLLNLLALVKPLAVQTKTTLDDKIVQHLEYILKTDAFFDWFYKLISDQFATNEIIFEEVNESEVTAIVQTAEPLPEAISPILIISLVTQIISLINAIKKAKLE